MNVKKWTALCVTILLMLSFVCAMPAWAEDESEGASSSSSQAVSEETSQEPPSSTPSAASSSSEASSTPAPAPSSTQQVEPAPPASSAAPEPTPEPSSSEPAYMRNRPPSLVKRPPRGLPPRLGRLHPESRFQRCQHAGGGLKGLFHSRPARLRRRGYQGGPADKDFRNFGLGSDCSGHCHRSGGAVQQQSQRRSQKQKRGPETLSSPQQPYREKAPFG